MAENRLLIAEDLKNNMISRPLASRSLKVPSRQEPVTKTLKQNNRHGFKTDHKNKQLFQPLIYTNLR